MQAAVPSSIVHFILIDQHSNIISADSIMESLNENKDIDKEEGELSSDDGDDNQKEAVIQISPIAQSSREKRIQQNHTEVFTSDPPTIKFTRKNLAMKKVETANTGNYLKQTDRINQNGAERSYSFRSANGREFKGYGRSHGYWQNYLSKRSKSPMFSLSRPFRSLSLRASYSPQHVKPSGENKRVSTSYHKPHRQMTKADNENKLRKLQKIRMQIKNRLRSLENEEHQVFDSILDAVKDLDNPDWVKVPAVLDLDPHIDSLSEPLYQEILNSTAYTYSSESLNFLDAPEQRQDKLLTASNFSSAYACYSFMEPVISPSANKPIQHFKFPFQQIPDNFKQPQSPQHSFNLPRPTGYNQEAASRSREHSITEKRSAVRPNLAIQGKPRVRSESDLMYSPSGNPLKYPKKTVAAATSSNYLPEVASGSLPGAANSRDPQGWNKSINRSWSMPDKDIDRLLHNIRYNEDGQSPNKKQVKASLWTICDLDTSNFIKGNREIMDYSSNCDSSELTEDYSNQHKVLHNRSSHNYEREALPERPTILSERKFSVESSLTISVCASTDNSVIGRRVVTSDPSQTRRLSLNDQKSPRDGISYPCDSSTVSGKQNHKLRVRPANEASCHAPPAKKVKSDQPSTNFQISKTPIKTVNHGPAPEKYKANSDLEEESMLRGTLLLDVQRKRETAKKGLLETISSDLCPRPDKANSESIDAAAAVIAGAGELSAHNQGQVLTSSNGLNVLQEQHAIVVQSSSDLSLSNPNEPQSLSKLCKIKLSPLESFIKSDQQGQGQHPLQEAVKNVMLIDFGTDNFHGEETHSPKSNMDNTDNCIDIYNLPKSDSSLVMTNPTHGRGEMLNVHGVGDINRDSSTVKNRNSAGVKGLDLSTLNTDITGAVQEHDAKELPQFAEGEHGNTPKEINKTERTDLKKLDLNKIDDTLMKLQTENLQHLEVECGDRYRTAEDENNGIRTAQKSLNTKSKHTMSTSPACPQNSLYLENPTPSTNRYLDRPSKIKSQSREILNKFASGSSQIKNYPNHKESISHATNFLPLSNDSFTSSNSQNTPQNTKYSTSTSHSAPSKKKSVRFLEPSSPKEADLGIPKSFKSVHQRLGPRVITKPPVSTSPNANPFLWISPALSNKMKPSQDKAGGTPVNLSMLSSAQISGAKTPVAAANNQYFSLSNANDVANQVHANESSTSKNAAVSTQQSPEFQQPSRYPSQQQPTIMTKLGKKVQISDEENSLSQLQREQDTNGNDYGHNVQKQENLDELAKEAKTYNNLRIEEEIKVKELSDLVTEKRKLILDYSTRENEIQRKMQLLIEQQKPDTERLILTTQDVTGNGIPQDSTTLHELSTQEEQYLTRAQLMAQKKQRLLEQENEINEKIRKLKAYIAKKHKGLVSSLKENSEPVTTSMPEVNLQEGTSIDMERKPIIIELQKQNSMIEMDATTYDSVPVNQCGSSVAENIKITNMDLSEVPLLNVEQKTVKNVDASEITMLNVEQRSVDENVDASEITMLNVEQKPVNENVDASEITMLNVEQRSVGKNMDASEITMLNVEQKTVKNVDVSEITMLNVEQKPVHENGDVSEIQLLNVEQKTVDKNVDVSEITMLDVEQKPVNENVDVSEIPLLNVEQRSVDKNVDASEITMLNVEQKPVNENVDASEITMLNVEQKKVGKNVDVSEITMLDVEQKPVHENGDVSEIPLLNVEQKPVDEVMIKDLTPVLELSVISQASGVMEDQNMEPCSVESHSTEGGAEADG